MGPAQFPLKRSLMIETGWHMSHMMWVGACCVGSYSLPGWTAWPPFCKLGSMHCAKCCCAPSKTGQVLLLGLRYQPVQVVCEQRLKACGAQSKHASPLHQCHNAQLAAMRLSARSKNCRKLQMPHGWHNCKDSTWLLGPGLL